MSLRKIEPWQVNGIALAVLAALTGVAYACGVRPLLDRHELAMRQQSELEIARAKSADVQRLCASLQQQLADLQRALAAAPLKLQLASTLNQKLAVVTDLAAQRGAGLDDVQPGKSADGPQFSSMPIHVAGAGSFPAFAGLLHRLRQGHPDIAVMAFDIVGTPRDNTGSARFAVDLLWYTEPAANVGKRVDRPAQPTGLRKGRTP